jgi:outer membrane murein-binding lipoprotein Lpp
MSEPTDTQTVTTPSTPKTISVRKALIIGAVISTFCLILGGVSSSSKASDAEQRADDADARVEQIEEQAAEQVEQADQRADSARRRADGAEELALAEAEAAVESRSADLDTREAGISQRETDVAAREQAVEALTAGIQANTFGDGIYFVGRDIQPGTYHTNGSDGSRSCYYAMLAADGQDILDNNNIEGPATITINSPVFEASGPCSWTKI